jgi:hypothetical protein
MVRVQNREHTGRGRVHCGKSRARASPRARHGARIARPSARNMALGPSKLAGAGGRGGCSPSAGAAWRSKCGARRHTHRLAGACGARATCQWYWLGRGRRQHELLCRKLAHIKGRTFSAPPGRSPPQPLRGDSAQAQGLQRTTRLAADTGLPKRRVRWSQRDDYKDNAIKHI